MLRQKQQNTAQEWKQPKIKGYMKENKQTEILGGEKGYETEIHLKV